MPAQLNLILFLVLLAALFGPVLWMLCGMPVRSPWKQARIDELKAVALKTAYTFSRYDGPVDPQHAIIVAAQIAEYRARTEAIVNPLWREAHMFWVRYSEQNLQIAVHEHEYEERRRTRMAELAPSDPLAGAAA